MNRQQTQTVRTLVFYHHCQYQKQLAITFHISQLVPNDVQVTVQLDSVVIVVNTKLSPHNYVLNLGL
jgi:hypothetical protein